MTRAVILFVAIVMAGCGGPTSPSSSVPPSPSGTAPALVAPEADAFIRQNDPATGCPNDPVWGHGFQVTFSWSAVRDATAYRVTLKHRYASVPIFDEVLPETAYRFRRCTTAVDSSEGWEWKVLAIGRNGQEGPWSAPRRLNFTTCRIGEVSCGDESLR